MNKSRRSEIISRNAGNVIVVLQCPEYVAVSPVNGDIVVTDFERHTVVMFDKFGRFLTRYAGTDSVSSATARSCLTDRNRLRLKRVLEVRITYKIR